MAQDQSPKIPFHPAPSVGHELGIMFGFIGFFILSMAVYYVWWEGESHFTIYAFFWGEQGKAFSGTSVHVSASIALSSLLPHPFLGFFR